jgi:hypothetical protein
MAHRIARDPRTALPVTCFAAPLRISPLSPCDRPRLIDILHEIRAPLVLRATLEHIDPRIIPTETTVLSRADTAVCTRRSTRGILTNGDHMMAV